MRPFAMILLLAALPAAGADVYKCKGAKGETIYQNLPCPVGTKPLAKGHYDAVPDDPRQFEAAEADHRARMARQQQAEQAAATAYSGPSTRELQSDAASIASHDSRSTAAREARAADASSAAAQDAAYRETRRRWGERVAGPAPPGYAERQAMPRARDDTPVQPAPAAPVHTTGCRQGGFSVDCTNSDGSMSYGSVDPYGNGHVYSQDGKPTLNIHRDAAGHEKADDGTCIRDVFGHCQ
jgi:hypothetical protein